MDLLIIGLWLLLGLASFVYWYTKDCDLTIGDLFLYSILAVLGPFMFVLGWYIHTDPNIFRYILVKKKNK